MTLGIVKINSSVTSKLSIIKKKLPCDDRMSGVFAGAHQLAKDP